MKTAKHEEILNEFISKEGTPERTGYENECWLTCLPTASKNCVNAVK